jgi:mannose-6-phosphate isomerase-like protein (cupin superfamily)/DNA-binding XRE family transcriptional regulator
LRELAKIVKLSPSLISQIETGKARPSVGSLYALTSALGLSIDRLFVEPDGRHGPATSANVPDAEATLVVRANNRKAIELESGVRWERMTAASHSDVDFLFVEYAPGGASAPTMTRHAGKEFGFVITGTLTVTVNFDDYVLNPGDSVAFPSTTPHRLWNAGDVPVQAVWVVVGRHRSASSEPI